MDFEIGIPEFFAGKTVFITGGSGFIGKSIIEKLLRCCPDLYKIYFIIRPKKGKSIDERVEIITKNPLFNKLKQEHPGVLEKKLIAIPGDCAELKLGLSAEHYELITETVNVIYHAAASVRFDDPLKYSIILNVRGTREVCHLALASPNLQIFTHVSTTYCNCTEGKYIEEKMYPAPDDWKRAIQIAEQLDPDVLTYVTDKILGEHPNTYTFAKALGEQIVNELCMGKIPTVITRPSIVVSSQSDPLEGWIDNFYGPMSLLIACGKGLLRCSYQDTEIRSDYIPSDITVKAIIVASWIHSTKSENKQSVEVLNISSGYHKWTTLGEIIGIGKKLSEEIPMDQCIWVPKGFPTNCVYLAYINTIFFHLVPALFLDMILKTLGHKPLLKRLQIKIYTASLHLRYFTFQEWTFKNEKMLRNIEDIVPKDLKDWNYEFRVYDPVEYIKSSMLGARRYLLKEPDENLPSAKIHYNRMWWLDKFTMTILNGIMLYFLLQYNVIDRAMSAIGSWIG